MTDTPVLIAGGGLTGLSAAVFLAHHDVPVMVVERHAGTSPHSRVRGLNPRIMELYRAAGLEEAIRAVRSSVAAHAVVAQCATLAGPELFRLTTGILQGFEHLTPCGWGDIDQNQLEPLLVTRAQELGVDIRFNTELMTLRDSPDSVTATVCDRASGGQYRITADYLIAADGSHGTVRSAMGVPLQGPGLLARRISVAFQADLRVPLRGRRVHVMLVDNAEMRGALIPLDGDRRWRLAIEVADGETIIDHPEERCVHLIRAAVGVPDLPVVIEISQDSWDIRGEVVERMRVGRVFLAGDAVHVMPPIGAFGASTGIQDAYNLAWKLALVSHGAAGTQLLDTYESERLAMAQRITSHVVKIYHAIYSKLSGTVELPDVHQVHFGYTYRDGAFLAEPGDDLGELEDPGRPSGRPGARAPHVIVERDGRRLSTIDLNGRGFVLYAGPKATGWARAVAEVVERFDVDITCYQFDHDLHDPGGEFPRRYGIGPAGAALVRPDGFVAWRTATQVPAAETLTDVLARVLCRTTEPTTPAPRQAVDALQTT